MAKIYYFLGHEEFQPEELIEHAILAEDLGFDGLFVSEHFNPWVADVGAGGFAFSTLGAIAAKTSKIKLVTGVVSPLFRYHPATVAQAAATLDRISNGRFELGVGTGEPLNEEPLGYEFPDYKERSERMEEALTIIKNLFSNKKISFKGKYYTTKNAKLYSPPLSNVSVFMAAGGPKSALLAAKKADGIILSVKDIAKQKEEIIEPALKENKNLKLISSRWTIFGETDEKAWAAVQAWRGLRAPSKGKASDPLVLQKEADEMKKDEILSKYKIVKNADDYIRVYKPLIEDLKSDIVVIQTTAYFNQAKLLKMLGEKVLPALKSL